LDRRDVLGATLGFVAGGGLFATLAQLRLLPIGASNLPTLAAELERLVGADPDFHSVVAEAHQALSSPDVTCDTETCRHAHLVDQSDDQIQDQIRNDFANRSIVVLRGWVLARTEARLLAMLHV
jgi:hypothetical protein